MICQHGAIEVFPGGAGRVGFARCACCGVEMRTDLDHAEIEAALRAQLADLTAAWKELMSVQNLQQQLGYQGRELNEARGQCETLRTRAESAERQLAEADRQYADMFHRVEDAGRQLAERDSAIICCPACDASGQLSPPFWLAAGDTEWTCPECKIRFRVSVQFFEEPPARREGTCNDSLTA